VRKDAVAAAAWFRKAALLGNPQAQFAYGEFCFEGLGGVAVDEAEAMNWYKEAAAQGHAKAKERLSGK
jgi:TPR repeat protein